MSTNKACEIRSYKKGDKVRIAKLDKWDADNGFSVGQVLTVEGVVYDAGKYGETGLYFKENSTGLLYDNQVTLDSKLARVLK